MQDVVESIIEFLKPHEIKNLRTACKNMSLCIPQTRLISISTAAHAKYAHVHRMPNDVYRVHSRLGKHVVDFSLISAGEYIVHVNGAGPFVAKAAACSFVKFESFVNSMLTKNVHGIAALWAKNALSDLTGKDTWVTEIRGNSFVQIMHIGPVGGMSVDFELRSIDMP
jgi:hypothetical protein